MLPLQPTWIFEAPSPEKRLSIHALSPDSFEPTPAHPLTISTIETPLGSMVAATCFLPEVTGNGVRTLVYLGFETQDELPALLTKIQKKWPFFRVEMSDALESPVDPISKHLHILLIGTPRETQVWSYLARIPYGTTQTYGDVAANALMNPKAARAAGRIVGANPVSVLIPCHRIVGANGALTGYHWGVDRKRAILAAERGALEQ